MSDPSLLRRTIFGQFQAALSMLNECIEKCPEPDLDGLIAKYPFWQVAYHTLCFLDLYLERDEREFRTREQFHPRGMAELDDEYPSRRFTKRELLAYTAACRAKLDTVLGDGPGAETPEVLSGPSGHTRREFSRAEMHLYNMRHVQHHAGQLSAFLRRVNVDTRWVGKGWR